MLWPLAAVNRVSIKYLIREKKRFVINNVQSAMYIANRATVSYMGHTICHGYHKRKWQQQQQ